MNALPRILSQKELGSLHADAVKTSGEARALIARREALDDAIKAVCEHCREGRALDKNEWHEIQFTNPDETAKAYCLATPIRNLR